MDALTPDERIVCADNLFTALLEKGTDGVFMVHEDYTIAYANTQTATLFNYSPEELLAIPYTQLLADTDKAASVERFKSFFRDKKGFDRYEAIAVTKDGLTIPVEILTFEVVLKGISAQCIVIRDVSAHKKMEAEIRENADRYKDIFDNANDLIFSIAPDGHLIYVNHAWEKTLGYTEVDMLGKTIFDIVHPSEQEQSVQLLHRIFSGELALAVVIPFVSKTGEKIFLEGDMSTHTVNGAFVSVRGIFRNITKKLTNERRIRELASIVDRSFEAIVITDLLGTIQYVNASWERLNGWTSAEVVGKVTPRVIKSGAQDALFYEEFWKTLSSGNVIERTVTNKRKNGELYQAELIAMPLKDEAGLITGFAGFQHDVTARNQVQSQLMQQKEFSEEIVENTNAMIIIIDPTGVVQGFNRRASEVTGYAKGEIMGKNLFDTLIPREKYPTGWKEFARIQREEAAIKNIEHPIITKSGSERMITWTNSEIKRDGKTISIISFGTDITDAKKMEAELLEKNRDLEQFKDLMVGRELRMIELKKELDLLKNPPTAHAEKTINQK